MRWVLFPNRYFFAVRRTQLISARGRLKFCNHRWIEQRMYENTSCILFSFLHMHAEVVLPGI